MPRQKLGQHFLIRGKILDRIARAACRDGCELVVEIGPGRGALTTYLLALAARVVAVELDATLADYLRDRFGDRLEIVQGDALGIDLGQWGPGVLTGNLPYYAATAIISRYLRNPGALRSGVFLIQKEVAERITASPGSRDYGFLSVQCQLLADAEYLSTVPPGAFQPPPKVDSAVIRLVPKKAGIADIDRFLQFASDCFRQKRKTLRNNLSGKYALDGTAGGFDLSKRAEQVPLPEMIALFEAVLLRHGGGAGNAPERPETPG